MAKGSNRRLPWRCKNQQQAKDKATIYNSRKWKELRIQKLRANPLCEMCEAEGYVKLAHCVHHKHPIEDSHSVREMKHWAFMWENLVSLCDQCHHRTHEQMKSFSRERIKARAEARQDRWTDNIMNRFVKPIHDKADDGGKNDDC